MSHVTHMNWAMSHIWKSHVTHTNASHHVRKWDTMPHGWHTNTHTCNIQYKYSGCALQSGSLIGCLKLQVIFRKRATNYGALLRKMTYKDKASYDSMPHCTHLHRWMSHVTHIHEPRHTYACATSHVIAIRSIRSNTSSHPNASCHVYKIVISYIWIHMRWRMPVCDMTHVWHASKTIWCHRSTTSSHPNEPCHSYEEVVSYIWIHIRWLMHVCDMTHVWHVSKTIWYHRPTTSPHPNESCHSYEGVMSYMRIHIRWLMHVCDMTHVWYVSKRYDVIVQTPLHIRMSHVTHTKE